MINLCTCGHKKNEHSKLGRCMRDSCHYEEPKCRKFKLRIKGEKR